MLSLNITLQLGSQTSLSHTRIHSHHFLSNLLLLFYDIFLRNQMTSGIANEEIEFQPNCTFLVGYDEGARREMDSSEIKLYSATIPPLIK